MSEYYGWLFDTSPESITKIPDVLEKMNDCLNEFIDKPNPLIAIDMNVPFQDNYPEEVKTAMTSLLNYFLAKQKTTKNGRTDESIFPDVKFINFWSGNSKYFHKMPYIQIGGIRNTCICIRNLSFLQSQNKLDRLIERMEDIIDVIKQQ